MAVEQSVVKSKAASSSFSGEHITLVFGKEREMTEEGEDRRRCERVPLARSGNYILESGRYYPCEIENVSATGMRVAFQGGISENGSSPMSTSSDASRA